MASLNMRKNRTIIVFLLIIASICVVNIYSFLQEVKKVEFNTATNINKIDGIVVLTGDQYRIAKGIELLKNYPDKKLLISGVNKNINAIDIMKKFQIITSLNAVLILEKMQKIHSKILLKPLNG